MTSRAWRYFISSFICGVVLAVTPAALATDWLTLNSDGRLRYGEDARGNRIPDFSYAGYRNGSPPPEVRTVVTLKPAATGDDTRRLQAAIDELATRDPGPDGFRGAILLEPGEYRLGGTLRLDASGIVLRGSGKDTVLIATGEARRLVEVGKKGKSLRKVGEAQAIEDEYVPIGSSRVRVANPGAFKIGDEVIVQRPFTAAWIDKVGMDQLAQRRSGKIRQWEPSPGLLFERKITAIHDRTLELDQPVFDAIERADGGSVWRYAIDRTSNVGIERLTVRGWPMAPDPKGRPGAVNWGAMFAEFLAVQDAWMRDIETHYFVNVISVSNMARRLTFTGYRGLDLYTDKTGAKPFVFSVDGQGVLVENCEIEGSNTQSWITQSHTPGPNVFRNCQARGRYLSAGPHQRWAVGALFDNVTLEEGVLFIGNRGSMGSGHGWAGANMVIWNSTITHFGVENPPGAYNWAFGVHGVSLNSSKTRAEIISPQANVAPKSLYEQQLMERRSGGGSAKRPL